jgi:hypothetical protein
MALKKTATTEQGFEAVDAYHRVEGVRLNGKTSMSFQVRSYKDNSDIPAFSDVKHDCAYDINGKNPIAQAYDHAKTLPEFAGAVDC